MEVNNYIKAVVGILVVALVAVAVILPIFSASETDLKTTTYQNEGRPYTIYDDLSTTYEVTATGTGFSINGTAINAAYGEETAKYIYSDAFRATAGLNVNMLNAALFTKGTIGTYITKITFSEGTATFTYSSSSNLTGTIEVDYTWFAVSDAAGDYVLSSDGAYIGTGEYHALYPVWSSAEFVFFTADLDNRAVISANGATLSGTTITDVSSDVTAEAATTEHKTTITATYSDTDYDLYILAPATIDIYDASKSSIVITIVSIIPVLILVGVLLMAVGAFVANRRA